MKIQTVDDLRDAQNALKRDVRSALPLPFPLEVEIVAPINTEQFFVSRNNFMKASWILFVDRSNDMCIKYPEIGLMVDGRTQEEFSLPSNDLAPPAVPILRYDLKRKYTYKNLLDLLPGTAIFSSHIFEQVIAVLLMRGIGNGRKFLRGAFHSNLFLVRSKNDERILTVRISWSYKQVSTSAIEGWKIETTPFEPEKVVRYETNLYTYSHLLA
jgi:hypothetical protein